MTSDAMITWNETVTVLACAKIVSESRIKSKMRTKGLLVKCTKLDAYENLWIYSS